MIEKDRQILFIDNSTDHRIYKPFEHWKPLFSLPHQTCHAPQLDRFPELDYFTHLIISGSTASVLDEDKWIAAEDAYIREAINRGKVIIGNCFGHQLIARSFFGRQFVRRRAAAEIGWPAMTVLRDDQLLGSVGETIYGFALHFDEVYNLSEKETALLLQSSECDNLAFKIKKYPVWGIQPHFEIGIVQGLDIISAIKDPGIPDKSVFINAKANGPMDSGRITRIIREFQLLEPLGFNR